MLPYSWKTWKIHPKPVISDERRAGRPVRRLYLYFALIVHLLQILFGASVRGWPESLGGHLSFITVFWIDFISKGMINKGQ